MQSNLNRNFNLQSDFWRHKYVIVLMLENRSFDNIFGYLMHTKEGPQKVNGVHKKENQCLNKNSHGLGFVPEENTNQFPRKNPGEEFLNVEKQFYGSHDQKQQKKTHWKTVPTMKGFVLDYEAVLGEKETSKRKKEEEEEKEEWSKRSKWRSLGSKSTLTINEENKTAAVAEQPQQTQTQTETKTKTKTKTCFSHLQNKLYGWWSSASSFGSRVVTSSQNALHLPFPSTMLEARASDIMKCISPSQVPVLSCLACSFVVCDRYFCDVPSQTFSNRCFFHAATSSGRVDNGKTVFDNLFWLHQNRKTLFEQLQEAGLSWNVFYDLRDGFSLTYFLHYRNLGKNFDRFLGMAQLFHRLQTGVGLSAYNFLEPRFLAFPNDFHPPDVQSVPGHNSVQAGEQLVAEIYEAIRNSPLRDEILFFITFDEHGGTFDHVPPETCRSPAPNQKPGEHGFDFSRLGARVPFLVVSSWVKSGFVCKTKLQHTSVMKTVRKLFGIRENLTDRDAFAPLIPDSIWTKTFGETQKEQEETSKKKKKVISTSPLLSENKLSSPYLQKSQNWPSLQTFISKGNDTAKSAIQNENVEHKFEKEKFMELINFRFLRLKRNSIF